MTFEDLERFSYLTELFGFQKYHAQIWNKFSGQFEEKFEALEHLYEESADIVMDGDDFVVPNTVMECAIAYSTYMLCLAENVDYDKNELYKLAVSNITDSQATLTLSEKKLVLNYSFFSAQS